MFEATGRWRAGAGTLTCGLERIGCKRAISGNLICSKNRSTLTRGSFNSWPLLVLPFKILGQGEAGEGKSRAVLGIEEDLYPSCTLLGIELPIQR